LIRMAKGEPVPTTELSHGYSGVELEEILAVVRHLFVAQKTLLDVNAEYIRSAAQADAFRTEPPFKLQGSYRNMNKIAEKVVSAMTPAELDRLIGDHYQGESQTLTTAAEQNLLKLAELRGNQTPVQKQRWDEIKSEFVRQRRMGGSDADPVTKLVGTISGIAGDLGAELGAIRSTIGNGTNTASLNAEIRDLRDAVLHLTKRATEETAQRDPAHWLGGRLDALAHSLKVLAERPQQVEVRQSALPAAHTNGDNWDAAQLLAQIRRIETFLLPVVKAANEQRDSDTVLANKMVQIVELLEQLDARLTR